MAVTQAVLPSFSNFCNASENMKVCLFQIFYLSKLGLITIFKVITTGHFDSDFNRIKSLLTVG